MAAETSTKQTATLVYKVRNIARQTLELMLDASNFPVVDPGYKADLQDYQSWQRREAVDPGTKPPTLRRIPL